MKTKMYGLMGLLSLLGFIGVFTENKSFLAFFAFAVNFEYFFIRSDEMVEEYMNKSAARGFISGMIVTALSSLWGFAVSGTGNEALTTGFIYGWVVSVIVYSLSTAYYSFSEQRGLKYDKN